MGQVVAPSPDDKLAYGEYLANIGHCMECHSPMVRGQPDLKNKFGAGGRILCESPIMEEDALLYKKRWMAISGESED